MEFGLFEINRFGLVAYGIYTLTTIWILWVKKFKWISVVFPICSLIEGLFIDWRWDKLQYYEGFFELILGGLPSFLIAVGFPFIGFYLHHFLPIKTRLFLNKTDIFPFSDKVMEITDFEKYFKRGIIYSFTTLFLHELSQMFHISSRNTFDWLDLIGIILGSLLSIAVYNLVKTIYNKGHLSNGSI